MNKQKTSKAWRWKVATFLPLLALLLMAFGKTGENDPVEKMQISSLNPNSIQDSIKNWTEADFEVFTKKTRDKIFFANQTLAMIQIDANSEVTMDNVKVSLDELASRVKKWFDYKFADQEEWIHFQKTIINEMPAMSPMAVLAIRKDPGTKQADFLKLLNVVANTILQIRGDYSQEIFGNSYQKITGFQRKEIDRLIPMNIGVTDAVLKRFTMVSPPPKPVVEIKLTKEGIFLDGKEYSLGELEKKVAGIKNVEKSNMPLKFARINSNSEADKTFAAQLITMLKKHHFTCQVVSEDASLKK